MVLSGAIDTEEEKDVILAAAANGRLKPERATALISQVEKFQKDANSNKILMYKNAVRVVMKEAGAPPDILSQLDSMQNLSGENVAKATGNYAQFDRGLKTNTLS